MFGIDIFAEPNRMEKCGCKKTSASGNENMRAHHFFQG
jgi:hypothetical protein